MTTQEIADALNAERLLGFDNWYGDGGGFHAYGGGATIRLTQDCAAREAEAIRRKRREIDLDAVMPLLEAIVATNGGLPDEHRAVVVLGGGGRVDLGVETTNGDVRKVVAAWKARRG